MSHLHTSPHSLILWDPKPWGFPQQPGRLRKEGIWTGRGSGALDEDEAVDLRAGTVPELPEPLPGPSAWGVAGRLPLQQLVPARQGAGSAALGLSWAPGMFTSVRPFHRAKKILNS